MDELKPGDKVRLLEDFTPCRIFGEDDKETVLVPKGAVGTIVEVDWSDAHVCFPDYSFKQEGTHYAPSDTWWYEIRYLKLVEE